MRTRSAACAAAVIVASATAAKAATVNLDMTGVTVSSRPTITVNQIPQTSQTPSNGYRTSGTGIEMTDTSGLFGDFIAWCMDLGASIGFGTGYPYETTVTPFANSFGLGTSGMARVQAVFDANYAGVDLSDPDEAGAFQLSLWEVVYDDDFDISTGAFQAESASAGLDSTASSYLQAAANYSGGQVWNLSFLQSQRDPRQQNLVTADIPSSPVPVPATGLLLLSAVGAFVYLGRRRA